MLFKVTCNSCDFAVYRRDGAVQSRKCPDCSTSNLTATFIEPGTEVRIEEPNNNISTFDWENNRWS